MISFINHLNPKSDLHEISPYNITLESQGHENKENDHQCKKLLLSMVNCYLYLCKFEVCLCL